MRKDHLERVTGAGDQRTGHDGAASPTGGKRLGVGVAAGRLDGRARAAHVDRRRALLRVQLRRHHQRARDHPPLLPGQSLRQGSHQSRAGSGRPGEWDRNRRPGRGAPLRGRGLRGPLPGLQQRQHAERPRLRVLRQRGELEQVLRQPGPGGERERLGGPGRGQRPPAPGGRHRPPLVLRDPTPGRTATTAIATSNRPHQLGQAARLRLRPRDARLLGAEHPGPPGHPGRLGIQDVLPGVRRGRHPAGRPGHLPRRGELDPQRRQSRARAGDARLLGRRRASEASRCSSARGPARISWPTPPTTPSMSTASAWPPRRTASPGPGIPETPSSPRAPPAASSRTASA